MKISKQSIKTDYKGLRKAIKSYQKDCVYSVGMVKALKQRNHDLVGQIITVKNDNKRLSKGIKKSKKTAQKATIKRTKALAKLKSMKQKYDTKLKETNEGIRAIKKELK